MLMQVGRAFLWFLPLMNALLVVASVPRFGDLFTDMSGASHVTARRTICAQNLVKIRRAADEVAARSGNGEAAKASESHDGWDRLVLDHPDMENLVDQRYPSEPAWRARIPDRVTNAPYLVNSNLFSRPISDWRPGDVIAVDSQPHHMADMRGAGIRCAYLITWEGVVKRAYYDPQQHPDLRQHLMEFANGADGSDRDEAWQRYYSPPTLDLTKDYQEFGILIAFLATTSGVWIWHFRNYRRANAAIHPSQVGLAVPD